MEIYIEAFSAPELLLTAPVLQQAFPIQNSTSTAWHHAEIPPEAAQWHSHISHPVLCHQCFASRDWAVGARVTPGMVLAYRGYQQPDPLPPKSGSD